jgi:Flp pilus assembly protein TadD
MTGRFPAARIVSAEMSTTTSGDAGVSGVAGRPGGAPAAWRWRAAEAAVVAGAAAVKAAAIAQLGAHPLLQPTGGLDSEWYVALASRVAAGDVSLAVALDGGAYPVSPLYVYALAAVLAAAGGATPHAILAARVAQAALGVLAVWLTMRTTRAWFGEGAGLTAGVVLAAAGVVTFHEIVILQSALDPVLMAVFAWTLGRAVRRDVWHWWGGAGAAGALLALNRPNALLVVAGFAAILAVRALWRRRELPAVAFAAFVLGATLTLAPAVLRNLAVTGQATLVSSHGGLNLYIGNRAGADGTYEAPPGITPSIAGQARDARVVAETAARRRLADADVSRYFAGLAFDWIGAHPADAARLFARKLHLVAHRVELPLNYSYAYYVADEPTLFRWLPIGAWCLVPIGLAGLFVRPRTGARVGAYRLWCALVPLYALSVAVFFVSGRYRLPLLMPLAVTGGGAAAAFVDGVRARRWRLAVVPAAAAVAAAVLTWWPLALDDGRLEERVAMASALAGEGRTAEAIARAAALDREHPQPGTVHYRVGVALQARGDLPAAEAEVRRALQFDPDQPEAHATLGQLLAASGRAGEARHHLLRAAAGDAGASGAARWILDDAIGGRDPSSAVFAVAELARKASLDPAALADLGHHLLEARRGDLAEPYYLALDARHPNRPDVLEPLGIALIERGQAGRAARTLQRAVDLDPTRPSAHLHLAIACVQIDRLDDAEAEARRAIELQPDYPQARAVLNAIQKTKDPGVQRTPGA